MRPLAGDGGGLKGFSNEAPYEDLKLNPMTQGDR